MGFHSNSLAPYPFAPLQRLRHPRNASRNTPRGAMAAPPTPHHARRGEREYTGGEGLLPGHRLCASRNVRRHICPEKKGGLESQALLFLLFGVRGHLCRFELVWRNEDLQMKFKCRITLQAVTLRLSAQAGVAATRLPAAECARVQQLFKVSEYVGPSTRASSTPTVTMSLLSAGATKAARRGLEHWLNTLVPVAFQEAIRRLGNQVEEEMGNASVKSCLFLPNNLHELAAAHPPLTMPTAPVVSCRTP